MHEMSIAQSLVELVQEELDKHQLKTLKKVKVNCGQLSAIVPSALEMAFEVLRQGRPGWEGAKLEIATIPLTLACPGCGTKFSPPGGDNIFFNYPCPNCGQDFGHEILSGRELNIDYLEAD